MNKTSTLLVDDTPGGRNVFVDLGFEPSEATVMQMRAVLVIEIEKQVCARGWSRQEVARQLRITARQVGELLDDTGGGMKLELLLALAVRAGLRPKISM